MTSPNNPFVLYKSKKEGNIQPDQISEPIDQREQPKSNPFFALAQKNAQPSNENKNNEESFSQKVASHPLTQGLLGAAKYFTWPFDVLKLAMQGEGLSDIDEIESSFKNAGMPFDREDYINKVHELSASIPTQQFIEDLVKDKTGIDLAPKDAVSRIVRQGAEILSTGPAGLIKQPAKQIAKKIAGAGAGAATSEGLKQVGAPETLADLVGFSIGGAFGGKSEPAKLTPEAKKLTETAEKHGLRTFQGMQKETAPKNAVVSASKQERLATELSDTSSKAIDKVIDGKLPIKKMRDSGVDLESAYTKAYDRANKTAKQFDVTSKQGVDTTNIVNHIRSKIQQIKKSAPSLSDVDKKVLTELKDQYKQLTEAPQKKPTILGPNGQPIPQSTKRIPKKMSMTQALDQYKNFNENVKGIYRKTQFTGAENEIKNMYGELNSKLIDGIKKSSNQVASELGFANKIFSQTSNLNLVESILSKSFKDGYNAKKLNTVLGGKKDKALLERTLGKDAVKDLTDIAAYGIKAEEKVFSKLKTPESAADFLKKVSPLKLSLLTIKHGLNYKLYGLPLAYDISKGIVNRAQGHLFTREGTRKTYINYLKHAVSPESAAFKKASRDLSQAIDNEYGSEEEFIDMIKEE